MIEKQTIIEIYSRTEEKEIELPKVHISDGYIHLNETAVSIAGSENVILAISKDRKFVSLIPCEENIHSFQIVKNPDPYIDGILYFNRYDGGFLLSNQFTNHYGIEDMEDRDVDIVHGTLVFEIEIREEENAD